MPTLTPFKEALAKIGARKAVGADLSSSQWADVPAALRERAFFSARVNNARYVQEILDRVGDILNPRTVLRTAEDGTTRPVTEGLNIATARAELKEIAKRFGYSPGDGSIQDLTSDGRINLQLRQNVEQALGYGNYLQSQAPGVLAAWPAQELFRAEEREEPRNWLQIWAQAGGATFGGRMIAVKSSGIWERISDFGVPWPPYKFGSGLWVRDVSRSDAEALGLIAPGEQAQSSVESFNARLEASARNLSPELLASLQQSLGNQVRLEGETLKWSHELN